LLSLFDFIVIFKEIAKLKRMSGNAGPKKIAKDQYLFREGDPPDCMYVIKSGKLVVVKTKATSEIILAEIGPGAMVGEMAFFDNKPRSASVRALKDSEVVALPYKALYAQFQNFPEWCKAIMRTVNEHLRNANQRIKQLEKTDTSEEDLFTPHAITKMISILNLMSHRYGKKSEDGNLVLNGMLLRNYTIQVFQEATHKMQKLLTALEELKFLKVEDLGEGKQQIIIYKTDYLFSFVEWYNDWLFKKESDRTLIKEEELPWMKTIAHFGKDAPRDKQNLSKVNLSQILAESVAALGFEVKIEHTTSLIEKKTLGVLMTGENGVIFSSVNYDEIAKVTPHWDLIYTLSKIKR
jgi:CRP/FNR family cyclic AMP-dependent transcriptional regulator